jgi:hypothetical protein
MQEKISQEYEKVKDKLSEEEFLEEIERIKADNDGINFIDDLEPHRWLCKTITASIHPFLRKLMRPVKQIE